MIQSFSFDTAETQTWWDDEGVDNIITVGTFDGEHGSPQLIMNTHCNDEYLPDFFLFFYNLEKDIPKLVECMSEANSIKTGTSIRLNYENDIDCYFVADEEEKSKWCDGYETHVNNDGLIRIEASGKHTDFSVHRYVCIEELKQALDQYNQTGKVQFSLND